MITCLWPQDRKLCLARPGSRDHPLGQGTRSAGALEGRAGQRRVCLVQCPHFPMGTKGERILLTGDANGVFIVTLQDPPILAEIVSKAAFPPRAGDIQGGSGSQGGPIAPLRAHPSPPHPSPESRELRRRPFVRSPEGPAEICSNPPAWKGFQCVYPVAMGLLSASGTLSDMTIE